MNEIIECVPNFSEGRDQKVIDQISDEIKKVEGVEIWDILTDKDHNRTVITFVGDGDSVKKAAVNSAIKAAELIDMRKHKGAHPRIGAVDVVPFIPLVNCDIEKCVDIANEVGKTLADKLDIPVYMYGKAAKRKYLENLGHVQNIQYENLFEKIKEEEYAPDYGKATLSERTGGSIVGARNILVAFNVNLGTDDLKIAKNIAREIRESGGGLTNVKAMGLRVSDRNIVQVSMDMVNYKKTPMYEAFEQIRMEAKRYGVQIVNSEIIGLIPTDAIVDTVRYYFRVDDFGEEQLIENKLLNSFLCKN